MGRLSAWLKGFAKVYDGRRRGVKTWGWWSQGESNPRPLECHSSALPTELWPHFIGYPVQCGKPRQCREPSRLSSESAPAAASGTSSGSFPATSIVPAPA
jgi:hypothetical protein